MIVFFRQKQGDVKEILDIITEHPNKSHICIFDELYSGTNPYEAICSAYSYLDYINKNKNVTFLLTTHFIKLSKLLAKNKSIKNNCMKTEINNYKSKYYYKLMNGISTIKGGISVLNELEYPKEILDNSLHILEKLE